MYPFINKERRNNGEKWVKDIQDKRMTHYRTAWKVENKQEALSCIQTNFLKKRSMQKYIRFYL